MFFGGILTAIVFMEQKYINSFEDLINSNLSVLTHNNSWLWYQFKGETDYNNPVKGYLAKIKSRMKYVTADTLYNPVSFN